MVLFLRSPIYTRIFSTSEYGKFALINITLAYISTILFTWILNCSNRYFNHYINTGKRSKYNSITSFFILASAIIFIGFGLIWHFYVDSKTTKNFIFWGCIYFITENIIQITLTPMRLEGKAAQYNIIRSLQSVLSFGFLLVLTFWYQFRIEAFFIAPACFNALFLVFLANTKKISLRLTFDLLTKSDLRRFITYGYSSLGTGIALFILISSDRYIIALFHSEEHVGIYNQVYNIAQLSLAALINSFQASSNPHLFKTIKSTPSKTNEVLIDFSSKALYLYLPFAILGSFFAKPYAELLLGEEFSVGWKVLAPIFWSALVYGLIHFYALKMKFSNKLKPLVFGAFVAAFFNVGLNFIFIPKYGYVSAAWTTFASYLVYLLIYIKTSSVNILFTKKFVSLNIRHSLFLAFVCVLHLLFVKFGLLKPDLFTAIIESGIIFILYFLFTRKNNPFLYEPK